LTTHYSVSTLVPGFYTYFQNSGRSQTTAGIIDDVGVIIVVVLACVAAAHQMLTACGILFDDVPTAREEKLKKCK